MGTIGKKEIVFSNCFLDVNFLFQILSVTKVGLGCVIVAFPGRTYVLCVTVCVLWLYHMVP